MPRPGRSFTNASTQTHNPDGCPSDHDSEEEERHRDMVSPMPPQARVRTPGRTPRRQPTERPPSSRDLRPVSAHESRPMPARESRQPMERPSSARDLRPTSTRESRPVSSNSSRNSSARDLRSPAVHEPLPTSDRDSGTSHMSISSTAGYRLRPVNLSDEELVALAHATKRKIHWDSILRSTNAGHAKWKWLEYNGDFSIFVREDAHKYAVLAIGVVPANVAELVSVMHASDNDQYLRKMEAIYGDQFRDGCFVFNADMDCDKVQEMSSNTANPDDDSSLVGLSVKTATFNRPNWLASHEEWCYLDAVYQQPHPEGPTGGEDTFEKLMTSVRPQEIIAGLSPGRTKYIENVVTGYLLKPEVEIVPNNGPETPGAPPQPARKMARVHFFSELTITTNQHHFGGLYMPSFGTTATDKAVKTRLLKMARSCARFPLIIQRRRLGVQNVIDPSKIFPPTNTRCIQCEKFLLIAKMCRLCGQGVCQSCSAKHYRETLDRKSQRVNVHHIRVCDICMERVEKSNYSALTFTSLAAPRIERNAKDSTRASAVLRNLLRDAYDTATSPEKKASVLSVIKCVVDQDVRNSSPFTTLRVPETSARSPGVVVTKGVTEKNVMEALEFVTVDDVNHEEAEIAHAEGRGYVIDPRNPDQQINHPLPENEDQRIQAIEDEHLRELGNISELNIICDLAAQEIGCFATMITVIDQDVQLILGANREDLRAVRFPRADTFCSHIIMDSKPLIVPHPEADIRFHQCGPVQHFGVRYYCGFPLRARDGTVLGSLCCVDTKTHQLTETQYAALQKLANTAAKVVRNSTKQFEEHLLTQDMLKHACCSRCRSTTHPVVAAPS